MSETGREFMRSAGIDPEQWAQRFLEGYDAAEADKTVVQDRLEYVTQWFADFATAVLKAKPKPIA